MCSSDLHCFRSLVCERGYFLLRIHLDCGKLLLWRDKYTFSDSQAQFSLCLTDSRSFLSYPRHEYFRRTLCNLIGNDIEQGLLPASEIDFIAPALRTIRSAGASLCCG